MGVYAERIKAQHTAQHLSDDQIRAAKCQRSKTRNAERKAQRIAADAERHKHTLPENRRDYRRKNGLKEFAVKA